MRSRSMKNKSPKRNVEARSRNQMSKMRRWSEREENKVEKRNFLYIALEFTPSLETQL